MRPPVSSKWVKLLQPMAENPQKKSSSPHAHTPSPTQYSYSSFPIVLVLVLVLEFPFGTTDQLGARSLEFPWTWSFLIRLSLFCSFFDFAKNFPKNAIFLRI